MSQYIDLMINGRETPSRTTLFYIICLLAVSLLLHLCLRPLRARRRILHLSRAADKMSPQEFFQLRMAQRYQHQPDFPGIYILYTKPAHVLCRSGKTGIPESKQSFYRSWKRRRICGL